MRRNDTIDWYLQGEIDITKGFKAAGQQEYVMWSSSIGTGVTGVCSSEFLSEPRFIETYESETGYSNLLPEVGLSANGTGYKTAVVANRIAYIGNVTIPDNNGVVQSFPDAILKSPVNKFDSFSFGNRIEAIARDGDEIVKLEEFADRILQFKKNKMQLINISQDVEFLEDTFVHKGVSHPAATCKTDFGIAWVNKLGCYLYDGKAVTNLLEKGGIQIIKESDWDTFTTSNSMIGYLPKKRQLIVLKDCTASSVGDIFLYDIVTKSWVEGDSAFTDSQIQTNFVTDWNGDLVHAHTSDTATVEKWSDAGVTSNTLNFKTKLIDFGQPAQAKKIYKVFVTHRYAGNDQVKLRGEIMARTGSDQPDGSISSNFLLGNLVDNPDYSNNWTTQEFDMPTTVDGGASINFNNVYSIRLYIEPATASSAATITKEVLKTSLSTAEALHTGQTVINVSTANQQIDSSQTITFYRGNTGSTDETQTSTHTIIDGNTGVFDGDIAGTINYDTGDMELVLENSTFVTTSTLLMSYKHLAEDVPAGFEVNDISIIYKLKPVK
tara:strand:- start:788 stop:2440 length:1653 start_codon:yes stop_codon:yes gene_type:complete